MHQEQDKARNRVQEKGAVSLEFQPRDANTSPGITGTMQAARETERRGGAWVSLISSEMKRKSRSNSAPRINK